MKIRKAILLEDDKKFTQLPHLIEYIEANKHIKRCSASFTIREINKNTITSCFCQTTNYCHPLISAVPQSLCPAIIKFLTVTKSALWTKMYW